MDKKIHEHEFVNHGIDFPSYFQGAGVAFTDWDECFTGIGDTPKEAAEDALEIAAQSGYNVDKIDNDLDDFPSAYVEMQEADEDEDEDEDDGEYPQFYVTLYVK